MEKKYVKIIKHLYKNLQKKDELKNEFDRNSNLILGSLFGTLLTFFFILFSFVFRIEMSIIFPILIISTIASVFGLGILLSMKINIFNNFVGKKLSKYNLFNLYGRGYGFNGFLYNITEEIIDKNKKEDIKPYIKEIIHIINSIPEKSIKNIIKMKLVEKMKIDVDTQLIDLMENKKEEEKIIQIDCKEVVVNN